MNKIMRQAAWIVLAAAMLMSRNTARAEELSADGWQFAHSEGKGQIESSRQDGALVIVKRDDGTKDHCWWSRTVNAAPGVPYTLSFEAMGWGGENHSVYSGVAFISGDGQWISFQPLAAVSQQSTTWPGINQPAVKEWKRFESKFTPPAGTGKLLLRLAIDASTPTEGRFRHVQLAAPSQSVTQVLESAPKQLPIYTIAAEPVSASGVSYRPDWTWQGAEILQ
jgi:hypothetical protein